MSIQSAEKQAIRFKGSLFTLTTLQLLDTDITVIQEQLQQHIKQAPKFFAQAPVIIDAYHLTDTSTLALAEIVAFIRQQNILPIGIRGLSNEEHLATASKLGLAIFSSSQENIQTESSPKTTGSSAKQVPSTALLITKPVRSGQQIYAKNTDLIVLSTVGHGAELLADGNIHVYGTLRGRALAGINDNPNARIFCQCLAAELVSIAGHYLVNEHFTQHVTGTAQQIYLADDKLRISPLP